jgi:hypothetical protein
VVGFWRLLDSNLKCGFIVTGRCLFWGLVLLYASIGNGKNIKDKTIIGAVMRKKLFFKKPLQS